MNFLNKIKNSIYNPTYYSGLKDQGLSSSFSYFFSLIAVLSLALAFVFGVQLSSIFSTESLKKLVAFYPAELAIQIKGGVVSTNLAEPYSVKDSLGTDLKDKYTNMIVFDTKHDFSVEAFKNFDTRVLVGKNFVVVSKRASQFEFNDVSQVPDFSLNQARILHWVDLIGSHHLALSLLLFFVLSFCFFGFLTLTLVSLVIIALIILLLAKLKKVSLTYKNSYQIALCAATVPLIVETIFIIFNFRAPVPFLFSFILIIIALINIKRSDIVVN